LHPDPVLLGGGHENKRRAGTENLAGIVGLVGALERFVRPPVFRRTLLNPLTLQLIERAGSNKGVEFVGSRDFRLANTASFVVRGADSISLLAGLDLEGICASSGSACSAGSLEPSHVIDAIGHRELANSLVRFSLGRESTREEVEIAAASFLEVVGRVQHC
jgi:cysteine desulfurase